MPDSILLSFPAGPAFREVASLVVGGVATRFDLPYERIDDLQLAVLSALEAAADADVSLRVELADGRLEATVGPLRENAAADEGLARVLDRLSDEFEVESRDGQVWAHIALLRGAG